MPSCFPRHITFLDTRLVQLRGDHRRSRVSAQKHNILLQHYSTYAQKWLYNDRNTYNNRLNMLVTMLTYLYSAAPV